MIRRIVELFTGNRQSEAKRGEWRGAVLSAGRAGPATELHRPRGERTTLRRALEDAVGIEPDLYGADHPAICDLIARGLRERTAARPLARELRVLVPLPVQRSIEIVSYLLQRQSTELASERAYQSGLWTPVRVGVGREPRRPPPPQSTEWPGDRLGIPSSRRAAYHSQQSTRHGSAVRMPSQVSSRSRRGRGLKQTVTAAEITSAAVAISRRGISRRNSDCTRAVPVKL